MTKAAWIIGLSLCAVASARAGKPWPKEALEAHRRYEAGEFAPAVDGYETAISNGDARPELAYNLGNALFRGASGDSVALEAARSSYARAASAAAGPLRASATYNAGNVASTLGDLQAAEAAYRDVLRSDPDDEDARFNLEWVQRQLADQTQDSKSGDSGDNSESSEDQMKPDESSDPSKAQGNPDSSDGNQDGQPPQEEQPNESDSPSDTKPNNPPPSDDPSEGQPNATPPSSEGQGTPPELTEPEQPSEPLPQVSAAQARRELDKLEEVERELLRQLLRAKQRRVDVDKDW